jgi:hypothetical protein
MFQFEGMDVLRIRWDGYFSDIRGRVAELQSFTLRLDQYLRLFNGIKDGVGIGV